MKNFFTLFLILTNFILFSQGASRSCNTSKELINNADFQRLATAQAAATVDLTTPYVLNVYFTLIKGPNGSYYADYLHYLDTREQIENRFLNSIKVLNIKFNTYNIYFKFAGFQERDSNLFEYETPFTNNRWTELNEFKQENAINFYFVNWLQGNVASETILGGKDVVLNIFSLYPTTSGQEVLDTYLAHTVGHCLSLYHTYEEGCHVGLTHPGINNCYAEHVTRDTTDPLYNANYAGDDVTDTPAQPFLSDNNFGYQCGSYIGNTQTNYWGETYPSDITRNYMNCQGFDYVYPCSDFNFTQGQVNRMRSYISTNTTNYGYLLGTDSARTDIATLYEPFDAQVIAGDQVSAEDQPENGGALVCRTQLYRLRFQPGFQQVFYEIPDAPLTQTQHQQFNYDNIFDHSIGVKIPSISNEVTAVGVISSITPYSCTFEPYVSGTVYSMEVLGSMNITVKELNEIEAKDPELYNKLMEQYYYILKKITTSGAKTEQTFFKN